MWRQHHTVGLSLAALLLVSCAKSGVDDKVAATSDSAEQAKTESVVVTGTIIPAPALQRAAPMDMMAMGPPPPPPPPPPPAAPGMYVPQWASPPYHDQGRDKFTHADENPFKIVREIPVSTFSIDVDTASYSWVRASLNRNVLPQPDSVRSEELINYFRYDYAPPRTREAPFSTNVAVMPSPWSPGRKLVRIGIKGYSVSRATQPHANLVFLIDTSGSMQEQQYVVAESCTTHTLLTAAGIGMSIVPSTIAATQGAKQGQTGLASGLVNTSRQIGGGLGIAVLVTLATSRTSHLIGVGHGVSQALTDGFRLGYFIAAGLCAAAALCTFAWMAKAPVADEPRRAARRFGVLIGVVSVIAGFVAVDFAVGGSHAAPIGAYTTKGAYTFVSAPGLHPPVVKSDTPTATTRLAPGYILMANFYDINYPPMVGQSGPLILDNHLAPVWFKQVPTNVVASNLSLQSFEGKPALAWWQGFVTNTGATETGEYVVVNQHYQTVATLHATNGWVLTTHEIVIQGDDAWVTVNKNLPMNLSRYGGAYNGALIDSAVQEYNLKTGKLLYTWDALKHIPLSESQASLPTNGFPWDAYHVNSIDIVGDGTFVVSMRNTWAAYKVNIKTGGIDWTLGGRRSTFTFGSGAGFQWQHDVVTYPGTPLLTLFDDHCCQITGGGTYVSATAPSRGLVLKLDGTNHTATVAGQYSHGSDFNAEYMGSLQPLPGGNEFVGWGSANYLSEYNASGQMLLDAKLPSPDITYRATVEPWTGAPLSPPQGAARRRAARPRCTRAGTEPPRWRRGACGPARAPSRPPRDRALRPRFRSSRARRHSRSRRWMRRAMCSAPRPRSARSSLEAKRGYRRAPVAGSAVGAGQSRPAPEELLPQGPVLVHVLSTPPGAWINAQDQRSADEPTHTAQAEPSR